MNRSPGTELSSAQHGTEFTPHPAKKAATRGMWWWLMRRRSLLATRLLGGVASGVGAMGVGVVAAWARSRYGG